MDLSDLRTRLAGAVSRSKSQSRFAVDNGFSFSTLNKFLRGELQNPRLSTIQAYEKAIRASQRQRQKLPG